MKNIFKSKKILIDNKLTAVEGGWKFDSNISKLFDKQLGIDGLRAAEHEMQCCLVLSNACLEGIRALSDPGGVA